MEGLRWGCVADDFTGASDLASFLVNKNIKTLLICGEPASDLKLDDEIQAVIIALKIRTAPVREAVEQSRRMFAWLQAKGCEKLYFKYCSTFDSTDQGNIGPVIDSMLEKLGQPYTILCPALLVNRRTVVNGRLYVNDVLLEHSSMRRHPLTPMRYSDLNVLIERQGKYKCLVVTRDDYVQGIAFVHEKIRVFAEENTRFYISVDFSEQRHGHIIMQCFKDLPFLTGGSGIIESLADTYWDCSKLSGAAAVSAYHQTKRFMLAGSCSDMTRRQIQHYISSGGRAVKIVLQELAIGKQTEDVVWEQIQLEPDRDILVYSAGASDNTDDGNLFGGEQAAAMIERLMAGLAIRAVNAGYQNIIVAGGETSGAVVSRLGFREFHVAESIDPGVPVLIPAQESTLCIVLKSGNFGSEDFFLKALNSMRLHDLKQQAVWIAKSLFDRGKVTGSTANLSFRYGNDIWITRSGSCFGNLNPNDFVCFSNEQGRQTASKEWPLHHALYSRHTQVQAVIHTHSVYSTAWSCLPPENPEDVIPSYTPYLRMKLGKVKLVPYASPGSEALFSLFHKHLGEAWGYLLANHGPIVAGKTLMDGFYALEELEESARIAWMFKDENIRKL